MKRLLKSEDKQKIKQQYRDDHLLHLLTSAFRNMEREMTHLHFSPVEIFVNCKEEFKGIVNQRKRDRDISGLWTDIYNEIREETQENQSRLCSDDTENDRELKLATSCIIYSLAVCLLATRENDLEVLVPDLLMQICENNSLFDISQDLDKNIDTGLINYVKNMTDSVNPLPESYHNELPSGEEMMENEIIRKYNHFIDVTKPFHFTDCPKVNALTRSQRGQLINKIVGHADNLGAYAVAMLRFLEYDIWMKEQFAKNNVHSRGITQQEIYKHWNDALSLSNERGVKGNYLVLNPNSKEDKNMYSAWRYTKVVEEDYEKIKSEV